MPAWLRVRLPLGRVVRVLLVLAVLAAGAAWGGRHLWAWYHYRAAVRALERHAPAEARASLAVCLRVWPRSPSAHLLAARAARLEGNFGGAADHLREAVRRGAASEPVWLEGALVDAEQGTLSPADESSLRDRVARQHPETPRILEALARGYLYTYRPLDVVGCVDDWLRWEPDNGRALHLRGLALEGLQEFDRAEADYRLAAGLEPGGAAARERLAEVLLFRHRAEEAAGLFESLLAADPDNPDFRFGLARCRAEEGRADEARRLLDGLLAEGPIRAPVAAERARLARGENDPDGAERWFRRVVELDPGDADALLGLAACLTQRGRAEEARVFVERAGRVEADVKALRELHARMVRTPTDPQLPYEAARICLRNGQKAEARRWLLLVLRLDPGHAAARHALDAEAG